MQLDLVGYLLPILSTEPDSIISILWIFYRFWYRVQIHQLLIGFTTSALPPSTYPDRDFMCQLFRHPLHNHDIPNFANDSILVLVTRR